VYSTVTGWRGSIEVKSTPGQGTTFALSLPVWRESDIQGEKASRDPVRARRSRSWIIEDEEAVGRVLSQLLSRDHQVKILRNGSEALEQFVQGGCDVVLIDLGMPGMPGDRVCQEIRRRDPAVATVLITGWELAPNDPRRAVFDFYLQKPFADLDKVREVVAQAVERHDQRMKGTVK
jgi:DNA-binding NtrC family response regulator